MNLVATFAIEKVVLDTIHDREQRTTGGVGRRVDTVRTRSAASQGS